MQDQTSVAVIGSGIAGLGTAWLLSRHHQVTLYEAKPRIGGHVRTIVTRDGVPVDTGFIVCNRRTYPLFVPLMEHLGVALQPTDMSFAASFGGGRYEYGTATLRAVFAQPLRGFDPRHLGMLRDILRFFRGARHHMDSPQSLGDLIGRMRLGRAFRDRFLLPLSGAIWSTPTEGMLGFPAAPLLRFFENHGLLSITGQPQWLSVRGGSKTYVEALLRGLRADIRTGCPVSRVRRDADGGVWVEGPNHPAARHDRVVIATDAPQALRLLDRPTADERAVLGAFRTTRNRVILHSDTRFLPRRRAAWACWNYVTHADQPTTDRPISLSYWMNRLQRLDTPVPRIVTLNAETEPDPALVEDEGWLTHPVFDQAAVAAQARLPAIQGRDGVFFAGAWTRYGFHEDGLLSALRVAEAMGHRWPLGPSPWKGDGQ